MSNLKLHAAGGRLRFAARLSVPHRSIAPCATSIDHSSAGVPDAQAKLRARLIYFAFNREVAFGISVSWRIVDEHGKPCRQ